MISQHRGCAIAHASAIDVPFRARHNNRSLGMNTSYTAELDNSTLGRRGACKNVLRHRGDALVYTPRRYPSACIRSCEHEQTLWKVHKDGRTAEARVRVYPHGLELRVLVGADPYFSRLYRQGEDLRALGHDSEGTRQLFEAKGWQRDPEA
jgi:hypothetical protein